MPRYARLTIANIPYHLIHRGNNKQAIFFGDDDYLFFLDTIKEAKGKYECKLYAYCVMTNHLHLLVEPLIKEHLALFIKLIAQKYTQHINRFHKRTGTLWEGRFKSCPVSMDNYLLACCRYIEMNPIRAGVVADLKDYRWSSYPGKIGIRKDDLLDLDVWYESLGDTERERQERYHEWFKESIPEDEWNLIREATNKGGVLGNSRFKSRIEGTIGRRIEFRKKGRPRGK